MKYIEKQSQFQRDMFKARDILTLLVLVLALLISYNLWTSAQRTADQMLQSNFDFRVRESNARLQERILIYEQALRSTVGFFAATREVLRDEFRTYINALGLSENLPGIQGIGYAALLSPSELERHVAQVRKEGYPEYAVWPQGERDIYTSIVYIEPFWGRNLRAFGFDMYSEPVRRAAMERSRNTGSPTVTGKVFLVQEDGRNPQAGFLMYLPVYRDDVPNESPASRSDALEGWVFAPFRFDDLMQGVIQDWRADLDIELYEGDSLSEQTRLYDSDATVNGRSVDASLRIVSKLQVGDREWTVLTTSRPAFIERMGTDRPQLILQAGISISFLLALLTWLFLDDRARALQAASQAMQLALYDALTGLPNRKLLDERLKQALATARREDHHVALLFIDLDKFKPVNDRFGHAYGDLLLKEVANRLQSCMRASDSACRLGGDEFVALLPDVDSEDAAIGVAFKVLRQLTQPFDISGHTFDISASIGVAIYPEHGNDAKTLIRRADEAMYAAKHAGRATVRVASHPATFTKAN